MAEKLTNSYSNSSIAPMPTSLHKPAILGSASLMSVHFDRKASEQQQLSHEKYAPDPEKSHHEEDSPSGCNAPPVLAIKKGLKEEFNTSLQDKPLQPKDSSTHEKPKIVIPFNEDSTLPRKDDQMEVVRASRPHVTIAPSNDNLRAAFQPQRATDIALSSIKDSELSNLYNSSLTAKEPTTSNVANGALSKHFYSDGEAESPQVQEKIKQAMQQNFHKTLIHMKYREFLRGHYGIFGGTSAVKALTWFLVLVALFYTYIFYTCRFVAGNSDGATVASNRQSESSSSLGAISSNSSHKDTAYDEVEATNQSQDYRKSKQFLTSTNNINRKDAPHHPLVEGTMQGIIPPPKENVRDLDHAGSMVNKTIYDATKNAPKEMASNEGNTAPYFDLTTISGQLRVYCVLSVASVVLLLIFFGGRRANGFSYRLSKVFLLVLFGFFIFDIASSSGNNGCKALNSNTNFRTDVLLALLITQPHLLIYLLAAMNTTIFPLIFKYWLYHIFRHTWKIVSIERARLDLPAICKIEPEKQGHGDHKINPLDSGANFCGENSPLSKRMIQRRTTPAAATQKLAFGNFKDSHRQDGTSATNVFTGDSSDDLNLSEPVKNAKNDANRHASCTPSSEAGIISYCSDYDHDSSQTGWGYWIEAKGNSFFKTFFSMLLSYFLGHDSSSTSKNGQRGAAYLGEVNEMGLPQGFGHWSSDSFHGESLVGFWDEGKPVGPFKSRDCGTGSGFICIRIAWTKIPAIHGDLEFGISDVECNVSGAFFKSFPRVTMYPISSEQHKFIKFLQEKFPLPSIPVIMRKAPRFSIFKGHRNNAWSPTSNLGHMEDAEMMENEEFHQAIDAEASSFSNPAIGLSSLTPAKQKTFLSRLQLPTAAQNQPAQTPSSLIENNNNCTDSSVFIFDPHLFDAKNSGQAPQNIHKANSFSLDSFEDCLVEGNAAVRANETESEKTANKAKKDRLNAGFFVRKPPVLSSGEKSLIRETNKNFMAAVLLNMCPHIPVFRGSMYSELHVSVDDERGLYVSGWVPKLQQNAANSDSSDYPDMESKAYKSFSVSSVGSPLEVPPTVCRTSLDSPRYLPVPEGISKQHEYRIQGKHRKSITAAKELRIGRSLGFKRGLITEYQHVQRKTETAHVEHLEINISWRKPEANLFAETSMTHMSPHITSEEQQSETIGGIKGLLNNNMINVSRHNEEAPVLEVKNWIRSEAIGAPEALVFCHGYNTTHSEALQILGQMASFGNFPSYIKPFLYTWPAGSSFSQFFRAVENAQHPSLHDGFSQLLEALCDSGIRQVHILAHSLGARLLLMSLRKIAEESSLFCELKSGSAATLDMKQLEIVSIVLLNPEYHLDDFVNKEYYFLREYCTNISIFCDSHDGALWWAELISGKKSLGRSVFGLHKSINLHSRGAFLKNSFLSAAGAFKDDLSIINEQRKDWLDVDVIDMTWLGSNVHSLRHSYWPLNREVIEDIRELIVTRKRARRRTSRLDKREGNVWVYRVAPAKLTSLFRRDF